MATNQQSCFSSEFLEQLLKFLVNFTLLKYVKSQRSYGFLIIKELIFGFQILDLKDHFSASLRMICLVYLHTEQTGRLPMEGVSKVIKINLIWHGGHDAPPPKIFLTSVSKRLGGGSWNLVTFNINLFSIKKSYFWFPGLSSVTMATSLSGVLEIFWGYLFICFLIKKF